MKILHTSDWHLGQNFMGMSREKEHREFLKWLVDVIKNKSIDILIVAGDIFDTHTPPTYAMKLYFDFLTEAKEAGCKKIIIIAGNHDSVSLFKSFKELLSNMDIDVVAGSGDEEYIIPIELDGNLEGVVCAVPFLRDNLIRKSVEKESSIDKERAIKDGIAKFYKDIFEKVSNMFDTSQIPIIATGHLTTLSAKSGGSERDIYIGSLSDISASIFDDFDYTALGHIHRHQRVSDRVYYSGSPIPLSFSEIKWRKVVNIVEFKGKEREINFLSIPTFRELLSFEGDKDYLIDRLKEVKNRESWIELELINEPNALFASEQIREFANENGLEILAIKSKRDEKALTVDEVDNIESLDDLDTKSIFEMRLNKESDLDDESRAKLMELFSKVAMEVAIK